MNDHADAEFVLLLHQTRQFLLGVANHELPSALRAKGGASDLVQETFASAIRSKHQFHGSTLGELRAWLRGILQNELITFYRRYAMAAARDISRELPVGTAAPIPDDAPPLIERLITDESRHRLECAVLGLPSHMQAVVKLRLESGLSFRELGIQIGRSEEAARKLFDRAIARLRGSVTEFDD